MACCFRTWIVLLGLLPAVAISRSDDERDFAGVVTHVFDGDSFLVSPLPARTQQRQVNVRVMDIDAPEKNQPYADTARAALVRLIDGRRVFVDVIEIDQYGRTIAKVYREPDRLEVARSLVHDGHVWVNRKYAKDRSLVALEDAARATHLGLWTLAVEQLVPPWQFRKNRSGVGVTTKNSKEHKERDPLFK